MLRVRTIWKVWFITENRLWGVNSHRDYFSLTPAPQDKEQMTTGIYTTKWFLQCFIDRVSIFSHFFNCLKNMNCMNARSPDISSPRCILHSNVVINQYVTVHSFAFLLEHSTTLEVALLFFNQTDSLPPCVLHNRPLSPSPCVYGTFTYWRERRCWLPWRIQPSSYTRVSMRLITWCSLPCRATWVKPASCPGRAAVAIVVDVTAWITSHAASRLAAS